MKFLLMISFLWVAPVVSQAANDVIRCEGVHLKRDRFSPATLTLEARSSIPRAANGMAAPYMLTLQERKKVVLTLAVTLKWEAADRRGRPARYTIASTEDGQEKGYITADRAVFDLSPDGGTEAYQFGCR